MLKLIGAGLPRTGTTSTKAALEQLGLGPCHHMFEVMTRPEQADLWTQVAASESRTGHDWDHILDGYQSAVDWPSSHYWRELAEFYPEAKVLLTVRDPLTWVPSFRMLMTNRPSPDEKLEDMPEPARAAFAAMGRMLGPLSTFGSGLFGPQWTWGDELSEEEGVAAFERHSAEVIAGVPADRLLVFDVREGWEPLCAFLGVETPEGAYPHLNDAATMRKMRESLMNGEAMPSFSDLRK